MQSLHWRDSSPVQPLAGEPLNIEPVKPDDKTEPAPDGPGEGGETVLFAENFDACTMGEGPYIQSDNFI